MQKRQLNSRWGIYIGIRYYTSKSGFRMWGNNMTIRYYEEHIKTWCAARQWLHVQHTAWHHRALAACRQARPMTSNFFLNMLLTSPDWHLRSPWHQRARHRQCPSRLLSLPYPRSEKLPLCRLYVMLQYQGFHLLRTVVVHPHLIAGHVKQRNYRLRNDGNHLALQQSTRPRTLLSTAA